MQWAGVHSIKWEGQMVLHAMRVVFCSCVLHAVTDIPLEAHRIILKSLLMAPARI